MKWKYAAPAIVLAGLSFWLGHGVGYRFGHSDVYASGRCDGYQSGHNDGCQQVSAKLKVRCPAIFRLVDNSINPLPGVDVAESDVTIRELHSVDYFAQQLFVADAAIECRLPEDDSMEALLDDAIGKLSSERDKDFMNWQNHVIATYADPLVGDAGKFQFNSTNGTNRTSTASGN